ncbi:MAG: P1 family peptidase [Caulobacteraceae bacterium]|nr:P1 family peptidase [Caulobacteraceae bacterium]
MTAPARPGARNLITDVAGLTVGQAEDPRARTGVTVILAERLSSAGCLVAGGGPGTRETDSLAPENLVGAVNAIVLAGGSVYGLAAADGVAAWLGARGIGYGLVARPGVPPSPIVPSAILYDLANGGDKAWGLEPPYRALGIAAAQAAGERFALGSAGAGYGALAGALKGGTGSASAVTADGVTVGAIVATNSFGSVIAPGGRTFWAAPYEVDGEFGGLGPGGLSAGLDDWGAAKASAQPRTNTTIACVATDAVLTSAEARRVAIMAQDGLARAVRPAHGPTDGDVVFALSTGRLALEGPHPLALARIGALAADCLARAIARAVYEATPWPDAEVLCWRDL